MFRNQRFLALIAARGGSKGLAGKNIIDLGGKPLIAWTIGAALKSELIDYTIVSTDCDDISAVALQYGANLPFKRPSALGQDDSAIEDVIQHALSYLKERHQQVFDYVILLQPTSPFRNEHHIDEAIKKLVVDNDAGQKTLVSVVAAEEKSFWLMQPNSEDNIEFCFTEQKKGFRRQKAQKFYYPNGAIYIAPGTDKFRGFYTEKTKYYVMDSGVSLDIDNQADLSMACSYLEAKSPDA